MTLHQLEVEYLKIRRVLMLANHWAWSLDRAANTDEEREEYRAFRNRLYGLRMDFETLTQPALGRLFQRKLNDR